MTTQLDSRNIGTTAASVDDGEETVRPVLPLEVELSDPLPYLHVGVSPSGYPYDRALILVRLHSFPIGLITIVPDEDGGIHPTVLGAVIEASLGTQIRQHLENDGLDSDHALDMGGYPSLTPPRCLQERASFLAQAPFVSIIVPTRDRPDMVERCLTSLLAMDYPPSQFEIIIVDNVPRTDATRAYLETRYANSTPPIYYAREDRSGSASARNLGLQMARGEIVAFTDDDVVVDRHWLTEMARAFTVAPNVACVTSLVVPMEMETPAQLLFEEYGGFARSGCVTRVFNVTDHRPDHPLFPYVVGVIGAGNSMAFRRATLAEMGNFDPALGNGTPALGGVDFEAFLRTLVSGYTLVYTSAAVVRHAHRKDYAALMRQLYNYGVGLSAVLLKIMLHYPAVVPDVLVRIPSGIKYVLSPRSDLNRAKGEKFPKELSRLHMQGMLVGPFAYMRSRLQYGRHRVGRRRQDLLRPADGQR